MIITKKLLIEIVARNVTYYRNKGYKVNIGDFKLIKVSDVNPNSCLQVECKCDICGKINKVSYRKYVENISNNKKYIGFECKYYTYKKTSNKRYGVDNPAKLDSTKLKNKNTCIEKYGCENPMQDDNIKLKCKESVNIKYGCDNVFQNQVIKDKIKKVYQDKFGVDYPAQVESIHNKSLISSFKIKYYNNTNLYYQGQYEYDFLLNYYDKIEIVRGLSFRYENSIYFSDFFIESKNLIVEIKSTFYYNLNKTKIDKKNKSVIDAGYNFIMILDKNYNDFEKLIYNNETKM